MKACFVVDNLEAQIGGWGRMATSVAEGMAAKGHDVGYIAKGGNTTRPRLSVSLRQPTFNARALVAYAMLPFTLLRVRRFAKEYDVVICYDPNPYGYLACIALLGLRVKVIMYAVGTYSLLTGNPVTDALIRFAYRRADRIFITSEFVQRQIARSGLELSDYTIAPVGLDPELFRIDPSIPTPVEGDYIISVGALKHRKGFHVSLPAFAKIAPAFPALRYVIVGDQRQTSYFDSLKKTAEELGVTDRVVFLERVSDEELLGLYNHAVLFLLIPITSRQALEGFGMVFLEANACGLATVGAYDSGAEAAIENGVSGLLAQPEVDDVAEKLSTILGDPALRARLAAGGIERARTFHWDRIADLFIREAQACLEKS